MAGMHSLHNRRFRRWVASGLAATWLFTVLACAADTDAIAADTIHTWQSPSPARSVPAHRHDGATQGDPCCQSQASAIVSFNAVKLPHVTELPVIIPIAILLILALPFTLICVAVIPDRNANRRRFELLVHSIQAQAPPR